MFQNLIQFERCMFSYYYSGIELNFQTFAIGSFFIAEFAVKSQMIGNPLELLYPLKEKWISTIL